MANINLIAGYPDGGQQMLFENILPAHSKTIFEDGLYESDFSPFIGRTGDQINLSLDAGAPICQPADIARMAGEGNIITYRMGRGFISEAHINKPSSEQRLGLEEELHEDRAQVPFYTIEKYASIGNWTDNAVVKTRRFLEVKPGLLAVYQRAIDWLFYRTLLYNDSNGISAVDSAGVSTVLDYFTSSTSMLSDTHMENALMVAQVTGLTAPNVYSMNGKAVRRKRFPVLLLDMTLETFRQDSDIDAILDSTAGGGDPKMAFDRLMASYLTWDFYTVSMQNGETGHLGHPLWPMALFTAAVPTGNGSGKDLDGTQDYDDITGQGMYDGTLDLTVSIDTANTTTYLKAALPTEWLRDWPQGYGVFWLPIEIDTDDDDFTPASTVQKGLLKCSYGNNSPTNYHDDHTFYDVKIEGHAPWPTTSTDYLDGHLSDRKVRVSRGALLVCPYAMSLVLSSYSIIYAPAPGLASQYVTDTQDYQRVTGVGIRGGMYFGPRMTYQRAYKGPIVLRSRMPYPHMVNGATLYARLMTAKSVTYYGSLPYVGQTNYNKVGISGDGSGNYTDPTDFSPGNTGETP